MHWFEHGEDEEARPKRTLPLRAMLRRLYPIVRSQGRRFAVGVCLLLAAIAGDMAGPFVLRSLIDRAIPSRDAGAIAATAGLFIALFLAARVAQVLQVTVLARMGLDVVTDLKRRVFDHILTLSLDYFDRNTPGRLLARVESDAERLLALFSEVGAAFVGTVILFVATCAVLLLNDARVALWILAVLVPLGIGNVFYVRYVAKFYAATRKTYAGLSAFLGEYLQAVPTLQVFGLEREAERRLEEKNRARVRSEVAAAVREYPFWGVIQAAEVVIVASILYFGARGEAMSVGTLVLFVEYARRLFLPIAMFSEQLNFVQRAFAAGERVFEVLDTPSRTPDATSARDEVPTDWKEIRFEDVVFEYGAPAAEGGDGAARPRRALDGVTLSVKRGERIAIVGVSGAGKTSLASLLLRYYDPTGGRIALDDTDIRVFTKRAWRRRLGLILQEIHLFPGTVRENLGVFSDPPPADEAIARALEVVEAKDLLARLPKGLDTEVAEGGANLSLGERQLLSFARALVRDPEVLVLDEATSAVDPATERRLQRSIERLLEGRTAIIIAHRLATVRMCDRIVVMQDGRIVEEGSHDELYARAGVYRGLYDLQFAGGAAARKARAAVEPVA